MIFSYTVCFVRIFRFLLFFCLFAMLVTGCAVKKAPQAVSKTKVVGPEKPVAVVPATRVSLAMALPLTGPYGGIGEQILEGANGAQQLLQDQGSGVEVIVIDTNEPDYLDRLAALPDSVSVVGGPLRPDVFESIALNNLNAKHAFFTFMQSLPNSVTEGRNAWRFFSSPTDQMRTLMEYALKNFGISKMGVLYPNEPFGRRVAQLYSEEAKNLGVTIVNMASYPPDDPLRWSDIVAEFLYAGQENAQDSFQAVFLPDAWSKVEMLVPYFYYHQKEHMLIMGSTLWGQTLTSERHIDAHNFRLSVYPSPWWSGSDTVAARQLNRYVKGEKSIWQALGFDFVRFVATLGAFPLEADGNFINQRIQETLHFSWCMAPITWDYTGVAEQTMFVLTPTADGTRLANTGLLRKRLMR